MTTPAYYPITDLMTLPEKSAVIKEADRIYNGFTIMIPVGVVLIHR